MEPIGASSPRFSDVVDLLCARVSKTPDRQALVFLPETDAAVEWSYDRLDREAAAVAVLLRGLAGERALLLYPAGAEFVAAFLGCLYAGVVAVPTPLPHRGRGGERLATLADDARVSAVLTTSRLLDPLRAACADTGLDAIPWLATDDDLPSPAGWRRPSLGPDTLAFLQYTSGSTSDPKGVMVTHGNVLANQRMIGAALGTGPETTMLGWLPHFHDMGLIGGLLHPLCFGGRSVFMAPSTFLQRPARWLEAISRYGARISGGPNFAYDLCVAKVSPEDLAGLDLGRWEFAFNGAEPVRRETLERFAERFAPYGFRKEAFFPCFGLAEATLFVSGGGTAGAVVSELDPEALGRHTIVESAEPERALSVVCCGRVAEGQDVILVDPETGLRAADDRVGEIWVAGPHVGQGYWNRSQESEATFRARVDGDPRRYLRTGDLGFLDGDRLYVTGRLKDLIIVDGRNHYAQDLEATVERSHAALLPGSGAAFAVGEPERVVVAHEVARNGRGADLDEVVRAVRSAVAEQHDVAVHGVVLLALGGLPRTTSGKVRRRRCRELFLSEELRTVAQWIAEPAAPATDVPPLCGDSVEALRAWLTARVAARAGCDPSAVDAREPFASYGLASRDAVELAGELQQALGRSVSPTLIYAHPTIEAVARLLGSDAVEPGPANNGAHRAAARAASDEPIAIVGMACRFPGAPNLDAYWRLLEQGQEAVREVPEGRWDADAVDRQIAAGGLQASVRRGGFLDGIEGFDPAFFGMSPREAAYVDPQQRLLLEVAWEALEDGGQPARSLRGSATGVFVGISTHDYAQAFVRRGAGIDPYWSVGNASSIAANRLSYVFDFRGPSLSLDTACSSSLVAVQLACNSLRSGECGVAIACGVNAILTPDVSISFASGGGLAPDGRCKAFDAGANGMVRSEGAGAVVLKPLSRAVADGDPVYAVIRGGAINQDGRSNGITAPNQLAQEAVLRAAYDAAGVRPEAVQYVEAHGAGTFLGDAIEIGALANVLAADRPSETPCAIGSVKTNLGHLEAAAGIAGVIKVALALRHGCIPASLHCTEPSPHVTSRAETLRVQRELGDWPAREGGRVAGVSSFGFGGTNAHLVLASAPVDEEPGEAAANERDERGEPFANERDERGEPVANERDEREAPMRLLPFSAATAPALRASAAALAPYVANGVELRDLCHVAAVRRSHLDQRAALRFRTTDELVRQLAALQAGEARAGLREGRVEPGTRSKLAFVFSGHGGQWPGMGRELLRLAPAFRSALERCDEALHDLADWSLLDELTRDDERSRSGDLERVQTTLCALQIGLVETWRSWGVEPDGVVGHSLGEVSAAYAAGALDMDDALTVVLHRSRLLQSALTSRNGGGMAALRVSAERAAELLHGHEERVSIAVYNSPAYTVLSGDTEALGEVLERAREQRIVGRRMNVPGAAHTPELEPESRELRERLAGLRPRPTRVPFVSTMTGAVCAGTELGPEYWARTLRDTVLFAPAVERLLADGFGQFVELGPHPLLTAAIRQCATARGAEPLTLPSLRKEQEDLDTLYDALGALYVRGRSVDWNALHPGRRRRVSLPTYPWQHERCWHDLAPQALSPATEAPTPADGSVPSRPLLPGARLELASAPGVHVWGVRASADEARRHGLPSPLTTADALDVVRRAAADVLDGEPVIEDVESGPELAFASDGTDVQLVVELEAEELARFRLFSRAAGSGWLVHVAGRLRSTPRPPAREQALNGARNGSASDAGNGVLASLASADDDGRREELLRDYFRGRIAHSLGTEPDRIDVHEPLLNLGIDSLVAMEVKNHVESELGIHVRATEFFEDPTVARLAHSALVHIGERPPQSPAQDLRDEEHAREADAPEGRRALELLDRIDELSDAEVDELVRRMDDDRGPDAERAPSAGGPAEG